MSSEPLANPSDVQALDSHHLLLAADRLGTGPGRTYTTTITCTDPSGKFDEQPGGGDSAARSEQLERSERC